MDESTLRDQISVGIVSGKGGVGKTSLTSSLAVLASNKEHRKIIVLDCDVDAPNLALILPRKEGEEVKVKKVQNALKADLLEDSCIHCRNCIEEHFCEFDALKWNEIRALPEIDYLSCEGCNACGVLCPENAFKIHPVKSGEIISYVTIFDFPLIYGKTRLGSTTSGKLVTDVKKEIENVSNPEDVDLVLVDGPPGIGCPVIATISGLDYVITITEPTPSGLHDLLRIIEVIEQFGIPFGIVINKTNLKSPFQEKFKNFLENTNHTLLGGIDFDLTIPEAMSHAETVIKYRPESKASLDIKEVYHALQEELERLFN
jgi:MinD superfamily P-loop ATPase